MIKPSRLRIGQKVRHALPGTDVQEWKVFELTDTCVTLRLKGFHSRVLRFEDLNEEDVVPSELDKAMVRLKKIYLSVYSGSELETAVACALEGYADEYE